MKVTQLVPDPNSTIYLHCATGGRATFAAKQLVELGYLNVVVITCPAATVIESFKQ
jgi:rhodanese-related sulfurtransferase